MTIFATSEKKTSLVPVIMTRVSYRGVAGKLGFPPPPPPPPMSLILLIVRSNLGEKILGEECPQSRILLMYKEFPPNPKIL